jgi:hypothetical protein
MEQTTEADKAADRIDESEQEKIDKLYKRRKKKYKCMRRRQPLPNLHHTVPNVKVIPQ